MGGLHIKGGLIKFKDLKKDLIKFKDLLFSIWRFSIRIFIIHFFRTSSWYEKLLDACIAFKSQKWVLLMMWSLFLFQKMQIVAEVCQYAWFSEKLRLVSSKIFPNTKWGFTLPANISWFQKRLVDVLDVIILGFVFRKEKKCYI